MPYAYHKHNQKLIEITSFIEPNKSLLVIPKLAFTKPFFLNNDAKNNLENGIMAFQNGSHLLLASHSGNGIHSYFKHLENLQIGDEFYIKEKNLEKKYFIVKMEYKDKDGQLFYQSKEKDIVILLTCSKKINNKQVYFIGKKV